MYSEKTQSSSHYEADSDAEGIEVKKYPSAKGRELVDILEKEEEEIYEVDFEDCSSSDEEIKQKVKSAERRGIAVRSSKNRTRYEINDGRYPKPPETNYYDDQQLPTTIFEKSFFSTKNLLIGFFCLILLATVFGALISIFGFSKILVNSPRKSHGYEININDNDVNITEFYTQSSIEIEVPITRCSYEYYCPTTPLCSPELDQLIGCCSGCDQGPSGECGLNVTVNYFNIPRTNVTSPPLIYLLATTDGTHFWQTGTPIFVQGVTNSGAGNNLGGMEYTNSTGKITNGCYGKPRSIAILGCLTFYNLTDVQFNTGIPDDTCLVLGGSCSRLNNVWQRSVPGCVGNIWVGSGFKLNYSLTLLLFGLFIAILS